MDYQTEEIALFDIIRVAWNNRVAYEQKFLDLIISRAAQALLDSYAERPMRVGVSDCDGNLGMNASTKRSDYLSDSYCPTQQQVKEANEKISSTTSMLTRIANGEEKVTGRWYPDTRMYDFPLLENPNLWNLKQSFESSLVFRETRRLFDPSSVQDPDVGLPDYPKMWDFIAQHLVNETQAVGFNKNGLELYANQIVDDVHNEATLESIEVNRFQADGEAERLLALIWERYPEAAAGCVFPTLQPPDDNHETVQGPSLPPAEIPVDDSSNGKTNVWHDGLDSVPEGYRGPITGSQKDLAESSLKGGVKALLRRLKNSDVFWGRMIDYRNYELYFKFKDKFEEAKNKLDEIQRTKKPKSPPETSENA